MRAVALAVAALCAAFAACSTDYDTFEVKPGASSSSSSSSSASSGSGGVGGSGGASGGAPVGGGGTTGKGGAGGGVSTGIHCTETGAQCKAGDPAEVCCHEKDAQDPKSDVCKEGMCRPAFAPISCDEQSDCNNPSTVCCATYDMGKLVDISCQPACSGGPGKFFVCSGGTICQTPSTCQPAPELGAFYQLCK